MSESTTRGKKRAGTTDDDSTVRRGLIGLDAEGGVHEIDPTTRTVYVRGDDGVEHIKALGERDATEWIAYVREERGWADLRYSDASLVEAVVETLETETEA